MNLFFASCASGRDGKTRTWNCAKSSNSIPAKKRRLQEEGLANEEARWAARRELENVALIQEEIRAVWNSTERERRAFDARIGRASIMVRWLCFPPDRRQTVKPVEGVQFRQAASADVPAMAQSRIGDPDGPADPRMRAYFDGHHHPRQALAQRVGYLAEIDRFVIGYIAGHRTTRNGCAGEVQYLYVVPGYRRTGIGSDLLRLLAGWFRSQGVQEVCVPIAADSPPESRPFFESMDARPLRKNWHSWKDIGRLARDDTPPA